MNPPRPFLGPMERCFHPPCELSGLICLDLHNDTGFDFHGFACPIHAKQVLYEYTGNWFDRLMPHAPPSR